MQPWDILCADIFTWVDNTLYKVISELNRCNHNCICDWGASKWLSTSQLPHSYYFTTCILVLKFTNKGVFFEEIQDSHSPRKRGYFGTHLLEFGIKGDNFHFQCFTLKKGFIWADNWVFYHKKRGSFWTEKSVFYHEKRVVLSWKVSVLQQKRGSFSNWRTRIGTTFSSEWGSRDLPALSSITHLLPCVRIGSWIDCKCEWGSSELILTWGKPLGNTWGTPGQHLGNTWGTHGEHQGNTRGTPGEHPCWCWPWQSSIASGMWYNDINIRQLPECKHRINMWPI